MTVEERTARLTILIDPRKKAVFERLCAEEDSTPSQVVRRLMRAYIRLNVALTSAWKRNRANPSNSMATCKANRR